MSGALCHAIEAACGGCLFEGLRRDERCCVSNRGRKVQDLRRDVRCCGMQRRQQVALISVEVSNI